VFLRPAMFLCLSGFAFTALARGGSPGVIFEPNSGQYPSTVRYFSRFAEVSLFLEASGARILYGDPRRGADSVVVEWLGGNPAVTISGFEETGGVSNYYFSPNQSDWRAAVPHYRRVRYASVFSGIDVIFYENRNQLEFDFLIHPGADPSQIRMRIGGTARLRLSPRGDLVIGARGRELRLGKPVLYQPGVSGNKPVAGSYVLAGNRTVQFRVGDYDKQEALIIDPTLVSTYVGGRDVDLPSGVTTDVAGNIYLTGYTSSTDFPRSSSPYKAILGTGDSDAFVMKLNATATSILYATFLGGSFADYGRAIAVDSTGAAYITGSTIGRFPTTIGAFRELPANAPAIFAAKLDAAGGALVYATYLDGAGAGQGIAVDGAGNAYVAGFTYTSTFTTTTGAYQRTYGGATDGFVVKLNPSGTAQLYSTFLGGQGEDQITGIDVDTSGNAYVTGFTASNNFPTTPSAYRMAYSGSTDAFVAKLKDDGTALVYSTYLGGSNIDRAYAIDIDGSGNSYIAGQTFSSSFPTTAGAFRTAHGGGSDAFVTKLNATGSSLAYSTFLGGAGACSVSDPFRQYSCDTAYAISVDANGQAFVAGLAGPGFQLSGASQSTPGGNGDAFVTQINATGTSLIYSTFVGGGGGDVALGVTNSSASGPVVTGFTNSTDFPVSSGALQTTHGGGAQEGFLTRLASCTATPGSSGSFFPGAAGSYSIDVIATPACGWSASSDVNWITITNGIGAGNGSVLFTVAANPGALRTGQISVNGANYSVQQVAHCITLGSSGSWFPASGGSYSLAVFATCAWSAASNTSWIVITSSAGTGNGQVNYTVAGNLTGLSRSGHIDVSGAIYQVNQVGGPAGLACGATLSKATDQFDSSGGSSSLWVSTTPGCEWTTTNPIPWITITAGLAGRGEGIIGYTVAPNRTSQARAGAVTVGGQSLLISQAP